MRLRVFFIVILSCVFFNCLADTYVVCVGIAKYKNTKSLLLPEKDAKCIADMYKTHTKNVILITGKYATHDTILKAINDQFKRAKKGDYVIFYFSGHGYIGGFCPYDISGKSKNALTYKEIYAAFRGSKASHKFIFADACFSGALRKDKNSSKPATSSDILLFLSSRSNETSICKF